MRGAGHRSEQAPSARRRTGDPARSAALAVLRAVDDGAYANLEMPKVLTRHDLSGRDAAFATELALGTIRR
ncbi:MAG: methyltransferase, partial [Dermacoccus nishinomiyaensis]